MKLLFQLILRDAWHHRSRISLAVLATVAMSCMIVWLIGSLDLLMLRFDEDAENYLGRYHIAMVPGKELPPQTPTASQQRSGGPAPSFPESVIGELQNDAFVVQVTPARQIRNVMGKMRDADDTEAAVRRQRSITGLPTASPAVIGIATNESPFILVEGRWFDDDAEQPEGVLGTTAAKNLQEWGYDAIEPVHVGDSVVCRVGTQDFTIKVVGLVEQNVAGAGRTVDPAVGALYVSMPTARQMAPDDRIDYIYVQLREGTDTKRFAENWGQHLTAQGIEVRFMDVDNIQERLNQTRARDEGALMGGAATLNSIIIFSVLVSVLIVFTALSMGVTERTRTFAMFRAVGMPRWKIATLVFGESMILCFLGWIGGTAAGWCVLQLSVSMQPEVFGTGKTVSLGITPIITAGVAALIASLLSAILPAWRATRISPLEGMNREYTQTIDIRYFWWRYASIGVGLLCWCPIFVYMGDISKETRILLYTYLGVPTQILGCLLLVPAMVFLAEKYFVPLVARLLHLPKLLLFSQLSSNFWRTLGTALAISVGLSVYSFLMVSGYSMLVPYIQSKSIPDTLVTFLPTGLPFEEIDTVRNTSGVDATRFLTIAVDQSHFSPEQAERFMANGLIQMQTSAVVFGVDIDEAFGDKHFGNRPLLDLPFQEGTLESALEKLRTGGRYCLVPDSFAFRAGVNVGDKLELVLPQYAGTPTQRGRGSGAGAGGISPPVIVEYEIAGVVSIHGWIWMNKISGVRKRGYRSGAMLLAPYEAVKNDYRINEAAYFWFDRTLDASGKPTISDAELEQSLQHLADSLAPQTGGVNRPMVKVNSRAYLQDRVGTRADQVIQAAAKMPLVLLAISCFGMMGTIAASVRSRRFEFGVLRSLGITRSRLVRLILAEALLIALVVIVISVGFGVIASWCFIGIMKYVAGFGSFTSPLTIPVYHLLIGFAVAIECCFLAALGPAVVASRIPPTRLLQEQ